MTDRTVTTARSTTPPGGDAELGWGFDGDYLEFLARKAVADPATGLTDLPPLSGALFPFQADIVQWGLRRGRAALFAGTGLGKSVMELAWGDAVHHATGHDVLLLTPLAVAGQMIREAKKFGIPAKHCRSQADVMSGITIANYEKLHHFDGSRFGAIILDEASILKALDSKTRLLLTETFQQTPFRLAASATPAPNDFMELGNHAEFLGVMTHAEMLAMFFVHQGSARATGAAERTARAAGKGTDEWRLKRHAESDFWRWMCSWAVMLRRPSDLGYEDGAFALPPLYQHQHTVSIAYAPSMETGLLFPVEAQTLQERIGARRDTIADRVKCAAALVNGSDRPWSIWCNLNAEADALKRAIPGAIEVRGSDSEDAKEKALLDFAEGRLRVLISKPSICGYGLNFQVCADTVFVGLNDSFEQVYQAIRRHWRFGQTRPVNVHFVASEIEGAVVANLRRKEAQAERMAAQMVAQMQALNMEAVRGVKRTRTDYEPVVEMVIPEWLRVA